MNRGSTVEYLKPAEALLQRALQLDPNNVDALAALGWVNMDLCAGFMADDRRARLATVEASAPRPFLWRLIMPLRILYLARSTVLSTAATRRSPNSSTR
jgi:hypothetical protein